MNFQFHLPASCALALAVMLAGCGQTGPLYMPVKPAPRQTGPANTAPPQPATATPPQPVTP